MLREFAVYRPRQVARFVKTQFKGDFFIQGIGEFHFDQGKVQLPDLSNPQKLAVFREVNAEIVALSLVA
ncbi:hypothetical protein BOO22_12355 [Vibrio cidicii]|uniref:DUF1107 domain-containing protein n=1 Tax=Vibrio cidicii TaxID=1763883 RepID=A0A151JJ32_9VIBR|nr:DUF1107 family protein [Vibrio cidicii]KYN25791.1 hypothetical protein AUQ44_10490 [Vibrio cidicii]MBG0760216.1 hypothetical protein [Vibrio cidicii]